jgi:hypothetical protein
MANEVPKHIRQRLAAVVDELSNAVGQEAAKAYLTRIFDIESVESEPGAELCDDSWMEFINEDCMTDDASNPSYPTPSSSYEKNEEPLLQMMSSQTEADTSCPEPSPQIANSASPGKGTTTTLCESCRRSKTHHNRERSEYGTLDAIVQDLPRSNLLDCLRTHWETLKVAGIFAMPSRQVFTWTLKGSSEQVRRLHHHLILRHLDVEDDLHQWRRSIAEIRNLDGYTSFFAEAQAKQRTHEYTRQSGESSSNKAHKEYLAHIYADRTPKDYKRAKQALKKDLRHGRRWSILVDGFVADDGDMIPGLGLGLLLLCGPTTAKKMSRARLRKENLLTSIPVITLHDTAILIYGLWSSTSTTHTRTR